MGAFYYGGKHGGVWWPSEKFPVNPTTMILPVAKAITHSYSVGGTLIVSSVLYNENEFTLEWSGVTNDMDEIVDYLYDVAIDAIERNKDPETTYLLFEDGTNTIEGYAAVISFSVEAIRTGSSYQHYNIRMGFRLAGWD